MALSPKIRKVEVGVREVREEILYPLSMADQLALPDQIIEAVIQMGKLDAGDLAVSTVKSLSGKGEPGDDKDMATIKIIMDLIVKNIGYILEKCMDKVTMADLTNEQFIDIVDAIFEVNYEGAVGKALDLAQRVKKLFRPEKAATGPAIPELTPQ